MTTTATNEPTKVVYGTEVIRRSVRIWKNRIEVDLTVRPYTCLFTGATKYAVILQGIDTVVTHHDTQNDAITAYTDLVELCENDYAIDGEHAWHVTDVAGIPVIVEGAEYRLAGANEVQDFLYGPVVIEAAHKVSATVQCKTDGFYGKTVEPATVDSVWCENGEIWYAVTTFRGVELDVWEGLLRRA